MELQEVVSGGDQAPFRACGRPASSFEARRVQKLGLPPSRRPRVFMDEPAEPVAATNRGLVSPAERDDLQRSGGRSQPERAVRALAVVVVGLLPQDALELASAEYEQPVEALLPQGADEALGVRIGVWGPERRPDDRNPLGSEDFVEGSADFASRSWIRRRSGRSRPAPSIMRLRACCTAHVPLGFWVQPASQTRRLSSSMKNNT